MKKQTIWGVAILAAVSMLCNGCTQSDIDLYSYNDDDSESETEAEDDGESSYDDVNEWSDAILLEEYLYNDEYSTMTRDYTLDYDEFIYTTLSNMTTNILDKKTYSTGSSEIFTSISRSLESKVSSDSSTTSVGYGAIYPYFISAQTTSNQSLIVLSFESLYPDSPLSEAGITREDVFYKMNGEYFTTSNVDSFSTMLQSPSSGDSVELVDIDGKSYTITAEEVYTTPIIDTQIIERDGGVKVGYLNYSSFEYDFYVDLLEALELFSDAGVTDFILDLRSNLGGYITVANMLSSCIASITESTPLIYRRYNDYLTNYYISRPSSTSLSYDESSGYFYEYAYTTSSLRSSHLSSLSSKKIYVLTTINTASASELIINSLRGIGFEVVTIGSTSRGKNVGSDEHTTSFDSYKYYFYPITMQLYNAALESDYSAGFTPEASNIVYENYPFDNYGEGEPLFDRAVELITGEATKSTATLDTTLTSRSGESISIVRCQPQIVLTPRSDTPHGTITRAEE